MSPLIKFRTAVTCFASHLALLATWNCSKRAWYSDYYPDLALNGFIVPRCQAVTHEHFIESRLISSPIDVMFVSEVGLLVQDA